MADMDIAALAENMQEAVVRANENLLWEDSGDRYAIYQIRDDAPGDSYRFMNMDFVNGHGMAVRGSDYALIYGGELGADDTLEGLYERFNIDRPQNFTGHSLSVSDVVIISRGGEASAHYVDSVGFQSLPDFVQERQEMWTQQLTMAPETIENDLEGRSEDEVAVEPMQDEKTLETEKPLYLQSPAYAREHGELEQYREFHEIDGGMLANTDITMEEAIEDILSDAGLSTWPAHREIMDYWELADKVHTVGQEEIQKAQEKAQEEKQKMMQEEKPALSEERQEVIPLISDRTKPSQSLRGKSMADIEETVLCYAQAEIDSMGLQDEVKILGARVYGSRSREGLYTDGSDLDVVLSYTGNIGEDSFFNALHESGLSISGMPVDINPISTEKTGTLTEYLQKADQYLDEKAAQMSEQTQAQDASVKQEPVEPRITFYVAECMEFPILGEWHEEITSLSEAVALYEKIPAERMNGIKGIGFTLYDGSMYDGMPQEMMSAGIVDRADVNEIQQFKESPLVQKALDELEAVYPPERTEKNVVQAEVREASVHEERTAPEPQKTPQTMPEKMVQTMPAENSKESRESNDRGSAVAAGSRKESVLQALRDRKAKMKEQEKTSGKEQDRKADRKKGEQSL